MAPVASNSGAPARADVTVIDPCPVPRCGAGNDWIQAMSGGSSPPVAAGPGESRISSQFPIGSEVGETAARPWPRNAHSTNLTPTSPMSANAKMRRRSRVGGTCGVAARILVVLVSDSGVFEGIRMPAQLPGLEHQGAASASAIARRHLSRCMWIRWRVRAGLRRRQWRRGIPCQRGELAVRAATIYPGRAAQGTQTTTMSRNTIRCER